LHSYQLLSLDLPPLPTAPADCRRAPDSPFSCRSVELGVTGGPDVTLYEVQMLPRTTLVTEEIQRNRRNPKRRRAPLAAALQRALEDGAAAW